MKKKNYKASNWFVDWINKHFTHVRDDEGDFGIRALMHIPIGLLIGLTFPLSYPLLKTFIVYEENEDVHTKDEAWKDYYGCQMGEAIGLIALIVTLAIILL